MDREAQGEIRGSLEGVVEGDRTEVVAVHGAFTGQYSSRCAGPPSRSFSFSSGCQVLITRKMSLKKMGGEEQRVEEHLRETPENSRQDVSGLVRNYATFQLPSASQGAKTTAANVGNTIAHQQSGPVFVCLHEPDDV